MLYPPYELYLVSHCQTVSAQVLIDSISACAETVCDIIFSVSCARLFNKCTVEFQLNVTRCCRRRGSYTGLYPASPPSRKKHQTSVVTEQWKPGAGMLLLCPSVVTLQERNLNEKEYDLATGSHSVSFFSWSQDWEPEESCGWIANMYRDPGKDFIITKSYTWSQ